LAVKVCNFEERAAEKACIVAVFEDDLVIIRQDWIDEPYSAQ
jgi:hypothetical protein